MNSNRNSPLTGLLERYPGLEKEELRRLRLLYQEASTECIVAISKCPDLAHRANQLEAIIRLRTFRIFIATKIALCAVVLCISLL